MFEKTLCYASLLRLYKIYILSSEYHFWDLDKKIEPYNTAFERSEAKKPGMKPLFSPRSKGMGKEGFLDLQGKADLSEDKFIWALRKQTGLEEMFSQ